MALCVRSFCEIVIVGHLNLSSGELLDVYLARDVCYGLFSGVFLFKMHSNPPWTYAGDPWELDKRARAVAEERQAELQKTLDSWPGKAHQRLIAKLEEWTQGGRKSAPHVDQIFTALRADLRTESHASLSQIDGDDRLLKGKLEFLEAMQETVRHWVPIYKGYGHDKRTTTDALRDR